MINRTFLILIILFSSLCASDFEEHILWKYYFAGPYNSNAADTDFSNTGFGSIILHAKPYAINSLSWNFAAINYVQKRYALGFDFNTFGLDNLYRRNRYALRGEYALMDRFRLASVLKVRNEKFSNFGNYSGIDGDLYIKYNRSGLVTGFGMADLRIKKPYDINGDKAVKLTAFASYFVNDDLLFSVAARRFENKQTRWLFDQRLALAGKAELNFGYMSNPRCIYGGFDLTVKPVSFIIKYYSLGGLSDTIIWGISFRE